MATITAGTAATFKQGTAEGQLLEVLMYLQLLEKDPAKNTANRNYVTGTFNSDTLFLNGSYQLPLTTVLQAGGDLVLTASTYMTGTAVIPGTGSPTFAATTAEAYAFAVISHIQNLEAQPAKNPDARNYVSGQYDADSGFLTGTFSIPCTMQIADDGSIKWAASEYLLT